MTPRAAVAVRTATAVAAPTRSCWAGARASRACDGRPPRLSQALEITSTRLQVQRDILHVPEHAQLVVRVGWPATGAAALPATPRRDLHAVLVP